MRLIDADAEIVKIEQEIQRIESRIKEWEDNMEDRSGCYDVDARIQQFRMNISDARSEIKLLEGYSTAYDVDRVVEHIREVEICGDCLNNKNTIGVCATFCDVGKKLEIIKAGGVDE